MRNRSLSQHALVWGARGFIGRALVADLIGRGWTVRVLTRRNTAPLPDWSRAVDWVELDGQDHARAFDRALEGARVVFNLAGSSGAVASNHEPLASLEANCRLQLEFLTACARTARRPHVVFASSRLVYAPAGRCPVNEEHPVAPLSIYAAHKLCVEHYHRIFAQRDALTFTLCRISNPYGLDESAPQKGYGFINALIQRALAGQRLTLFEPALQLRDYLYIDDLTTMLRLCAERVEARNALLNIGFGTSLSIADAAAQIHRVLGSDGIEFKPWPPDYEAVESGDFVVDTAKSLALLGCSPAFSFESGLAHLKLRSSRTGSAAPPLYVPLGGDVEAPIPTQR